MASDPIISLANGAGVIHIISGTPRRADELCPVCFNPALFDVDIYGYGDDPTQARLLARQRFCHDCELAWVRR